MKKLLVWLLTLALLMSTLLTSLLPVAAEEGETLPPVGDEETTETPKVADQKGNCGETVGWKYYVDTETLVISGVGAMADYASPANIPWISLGTKIKNVVIREGVTHIGRYSLTGLAAERLELPRSVESIGDYAFAGSSILREVVMPADGSLKTIGSLAFYNNRRITSLTIPETVTSIAAMNFAGCYKLLQITNLSEATIDTTYLSGLTEIRTSESTPFEGVIATDGEGFMSYTRDGEVYLLAYTGAETELDLTGRGFTSLYPYVFYQNTDIKSIVLPAGLSLDVSSGAFQQCTSLESLTLPSDATKIPSYFADYCTSLASIEIPETVTEIGGSAFASTAIKEVSIPAATEVIKSSAFGECRKLWRVTIAENSSLHTIQYGAFRNTSLFSFTIPASVTTIAWDVFQYSNTVQITNLSGQPILGYEPQINHDDLSATSPYPVVDSELRSSESTPFYHTLTYHDDGVVTYTVGDEVWLMGYVGDLKEIDLSNYNITKIYSSAFNESEIEKIVLPSGVTYIGSSAFSYSAIKEIEIPASVTFIGGYAFNYCEDLRTLTFAENSQMKIFDGWATFYGCSSLTAVHLPEGVETLSSQMFAECVNLREVTIPSTVKESADGFYNTFYNCRKLIRVTNLSQYLVFSPNTYGELRTSKSTPFASTLTVTEDGYVLYTPGSGYVQGEIFLLGYEGDETELDLSSLPIKHIYANALRGNTAITSVHFPATLTQIREYAFAECPSLTTVTFEEGSTLEYFYQSVFYNCPKLESVEIPASVKELSSAFDDCTALKEVHIESLAAWCAIPHSYEDYNPLYYGADLYLGGELVTDLQIPSTVEKLYPYAFAGGTFTSVTIPATVTEIGYGAFYGCKNLETADVSATVYKLNGYTFRDCVNLTQVTLPENLMILGYGEFMGCENLRSITLPQSMATIGDWAFKGCKSLLSIELPASVTTVGALVFGECDRLVQITNLSSHTFTDLPENIGLEVRTSKDTPFASVLATDDESGLTTLTVGDVVYLIDYKGDATELNLLGTGVTAIYAYAFYQADNLTRLVLPKSVTSIGDYAFLGCEALTELVLPDSLTSVGAYVLMNFDTEQIPFHGSEEQLRAITGLDQSNALLAYFITPSAHSYGKWTDREDGTHSSTCECGDFHSEEHIWDDGTETKAATHLEAGVMLHGCTVCDAEKEEPIDKLPTHTFEYESKDDEEHTKSCECGLTEDEDHEWDDGEVTTPPTHEEKGERTFTCEHCGHTKTEEVDKLTEHSYECNKHDASQHKMECICGDFYLEDHAWNAGEVTTEPTVDAEGVRTFTCTECGETRTESIDRLPPVVTDPSDGNGNGNDTPPAGDDNTSSGGDDSSAKAEDGGCGSAVSSGLSVMLLLGAAVALTKKKKD